MSIDYGKTDQIEMEKSIAKPYDRKMKRLKEFHAVKTPPPEVTAFYTNGGGGDNFKGDHIDMIPHIQQRWNIK